MVLVEMVVKPLRVIDRKELAHLAHEVQIDSARNRAARQWCEQQFGSRWNPVDNRGGSWAVFWTGSSAFDKYRFCFAHEQDMMWFSLRWA